MNYLTIGHAQHGKDTVAEYLRDRYGIQFESSSLIAIREFLFAEAQNCPQLLEEGISFYNHWQMYERRGEIRAWMHRKIREYNTPDLTAMAKLILSKVPHYQGLRNREELEANKAAGTFDLIIWVDACERKPLEPADSMQLCREDADVVLDNNGTLEELYVQIDVLMCSLRLVQCEDRITKRLDTCFDEDGFSRVLERFSEQVA